LTLSATATAFTVWGVWLALAVLVGSMVDAVRRFRRLRGKIRWSWSGALIAIAILLVLRAGIRHFIVEAFKVPSSSMGPTLQIGDHFFVNKLAPRWRSPRRGEVIVFRQPCSADRDYVMRAIALENDTVELRCGVVYVNGIASPTTLELASDLNRELVDFPDPWRETTVYRESIDGRTYQVFQDPDRPARADGAGFELLGELSPLSRPDWPVLWLRLHLGHSMRLSESVHGSGSIPVLGRAPALAMRMGPHGMGGTA
jgi:signal peptidase I